jgi:hypothetical protein
MIFDFTLSFSLDEFYEQGQPSNNTVGGILVFVFCERLGMLLI